jgi:hypothetical protein
VSVKVWFFSHRGSAKKIRGLLLIKKYVLGSGSVPRRQVLLVKPANENLAHPYSTHTTSQPQPFYSSREKKQATRAPSTPPQEPHCCQHRRRPHHFYTAVGAPPPPQEPPPTTTAIGGPAPSAAIKRLGYVPPSIPQPSAIHDDAITAGAPPSLDPSTSSAQATGTSLTVFLVRPLAWSTS